MTKRTDNASRKHFAPGPLLWPLLYISLGYWVAQYANGPPGLTLRQKIGTPSVPSTRANAVAQGEEYGGMEDVGGAALFAGGNVPLAGGGDGGVW